MRWQVSAKNARRSAYRRLEIAFVALVGCHVPQIRPTAESLAFRWKYLLTYSPAD